MKITNYLHFFIKPFFSFLIFIPFFFFAHSTVYATACNWQSTGSTSWNTAANWSCSHVPTSSDTVAFSSSANTSVTLDADVNVNSLTIGSSYSGTFDQSTHTITLGFNGYTQSSGIFIGTGYAMTVNGSFIISGGTFTPPSGTFLVSKNFTISNNPTFTGHFPNLTVGGGDATGIYTCGNAVFDAVTISRFSSTYTVTVSSGCIFPISGTNPSSTGVVINSGTVNIVGNWTIAGGYTGNSGGVLTMTGTSLTVSSNLVLNSDTTFPSGLTALTVGGNLDNTGNALPSGLAVTLNINSNAIITCGTTTFNSVVLNKPYADVTFNSGCVIPLIDTDSTDVNAIYNAGTINVTGNWTVAGSYTGNSGGVLNITGTALTVSLALTLNSGTTFPSGLTTLTVGGNLDNTGNVLPSGLALTLNTNNNAIVTCGTATFNSVTFNKLYAYITFKSGCVIPLIGADSNSVDTIYNSGTISVTGNWTLTGGYTGNSGGVLTMTGTSLAVTGNLVLNSGTTFPSGITTLTVGRNLDNSGNALPSGIALTINGGNDATFTCGTVTFGSVILNKPAYTTFKTGCVIPLTGSSTSSLITNSGTINVTGNWTLTGSYTGSSGGVLSMTGTSLTVSNNLVLNSGTTFPSALATLTVGGNLNNSGNSLPAGLDVIINGSGDATFTAGTAVFNSITVNKSFSSNYFVVGSDITAHDFILTKGKVTNPASAKVLSISGNFTESDTSIFGGANLTANFNGSNTQTISKAAGTFSSLLNINSTGTVQLSTDFSTSGTACTVQGGIFDLNGKAFTCGSTFTVQNGGTLKMIGTESPTTPTLNTGSTVSYKGDGDSAVDTYTLPNWTYPNLEVNFLDPGDILGPGALSAITIGGNLILTQGSFTSPSTLNLAGNFTNNATFTHNNGTVVLNGTDQTLTGSTTFNNLSKTVSAARTLTLASASSQTILGTLTLQGAADNLLSLRSSSTGVQWVVDPRGTRTISYLDIKDSHNTNAAFMDAVGTHSVNSGNNTNWKFSLPSPPTLLGPNTLISGSYTNNNQPQFTFTLSNDDAYATVKYEIQIAATSNFSTPVLDYTSSLAAPSVQSFTLGQGSGSGTYTTGSANQHLDEGIYYWRVKEIDNLGESSSYSTANSGNMAFRIDTIAPSDGSITYSNGYLTSSSVSLSVNDGTDATSGINSSSRIMQRRAADLILGICGIYGNFSTISPTGDYQNYIDATVSSGKCYQYQYLVSDNAQNQAAYTSGSASRIDTSIPTTPGSPTTTSPTKSVSQSWTWVAATDAVSDIANYAWRVVTSAGTAVADGVSNTASVITNLTDGIYNFFVKAVSHAGSSGEESTSSLTVDATGPLITSVLSTPTSAGATVNWVTNEESSSKIDYGLTDSYGNSTEETDTSIRVKNHSVALSGFISCTTYHYRVRSTDVLGNTRIAGDNTFTTDGCAASSAIMATASKPITSTEGGTLSLQDEDSNGLVVTVPAFSAESDAVFQAHQLDKTTVLATTSKPAGYSAAGGYIYELKALTDITTTVSTFNPALTISVAYGASDISGLDDKTLKIYRWDDGSWHQLTGCVVDISAKNVACTTTNFSVFGLFGQPMAANPTGTSLSSNSSGTSSLASAPVCDDQAPGAKPPWLYGAIAQGSDSVLLYFTEADNPVSKYVLEFGTKPGDYSYGVSDMGVNSRGQMTFLVKSLSVDTTYYFRVRGGNGCATGFWSNEISAKTRGLVSFNQLKIAQSDLEPEPIAETPTNTSCQTYTVKSGDTLWSIAKSMLSDANKYKEIIEQNKDTYPSLETSNNLTAEWKLHINCGKPRSADETPAPGGYNVRVKVTDTAKNPVAGATVTLHSDPQTTKTDANGMAYFYHVDQGNHQILIAYNNYQGEQSVNLTGDVKEFDLNLTVHQNPIEFSALIYWIMGIMGLVIIILLIFLVKAKRRI